MNLNKENRYFFIWMGSFLADETVLCGKRGAVDMADHTEADGLPKNFSDFIAVFTGENTAANTADQRTQDTAYDSTNTGEDR